MGGGGGGGGGRGGVLPKKEAWTVSRLKGGLGKKNMGWGYFREGVDTPMHAISESYQLHLNLSLHVIWLMPGSSKF